MASIHEIKISQKSCDTAPLNKQNIVRTKYVYLLLPGDIVVVKIYIPSTYRWQLVLLRLQRLYGMRSCSCRLQHIVVITKKLFWLLHYTPVTSSGKGLRVRLFGPSKELPCLLTPLLRVGTASFFKKFLRLFGGWVEKLSGVKCSRQIVAPGPGTQSGWR